MMDISMCKLLIVQASISLTDLRLAYHRLLPKFISSSYLTRTRFLPMHAYPKH